MFDILTILVESSATHSAVLKLKVVQIETNIMTLVRDVFNVRLCIVESVTRYAAATSEESSREEIHAEREADKRNTCDHRTTINTTGTDELLSRYTVD